DLLVRAINQENVRAQRESVQVVRCAELVEIRGGHFGRFRMLHHSAGILAGNAPAIARIERQRYPPRRRGGKIRLGLEPRCALNGGVCRVQVIADIEAKIIEAQAWVKMKRLRQEVYALLECAPPHW